MARALHAPLDVLLVKKIGHPANPEYAIGMVTLDNFIVREHQGIPAAYIAEEVTRLQVLLRERQAQYHKGKAPIVLKGKTVLLVDDGLATGSTMLAAVRLVRKANPAKVIVAVPIAPSDAIISLDAEADAVVCLHIAPHFTAVGEFYDSFPQVEDEEAIKLLQG